MWMVERGRGGIYEEGSSPTPETITRLPVPNTQHFMPKTPKTQHPVFHIQNVEAKHLKSWSNGSKHLSNFPKNRSNAATSRSTLPASRSPRGASSSLQAEAPKFAVKVANVRFASVRTIPCGEASMDHGPCFEVGAHRETTTK